MSLETEVMAQMKDAMKARDEALLRGLRAIKAELLKVKTEPGANGQVTEEGELKILRKLVKSRKDSLEIYQQQNRPDLATKESEEIAVIEKFLPKQLSEAELKEVVAKIISETGATGPQDMGKLMGIVSKQLAGKADGKMIAAAVKELLNK
ncbi:MAG: GatB/YqeY domain-containing protein [Bacteroidota bacterium]